MGNVERRLYRTNAHLQSSLLFFQPLPEFGKHIVISCWAFALFKVSDHVYVILKNTTTQKSNYVNIFDNNNANISDNKYICYHLKLLLFFSQSGREPLNGHLVSLQFSFGLIQQLLVLLLLSILPLSDLVAQLFQLIVQILEVRWGGITQNPVCT